MLTVMKWLVTLSKLLWLSLPKQVNFGLEQKAADFD